MSQTESGGETALYDKLKQIWAHPVVRWMALVPTALSALASVKEVGQYAHYIVSNWHPVVAYVGQLVSPFAIHIDLPKATIVVLVFFAPFSAYGLYDTVVNNRAAPTFWNGALVCVIYFWLWGALRDESILSVWGLIFAGIAIGGYAIFYFRIEKTRPIFKYSLPLGALSAFLVIFGAVVISEHGWKLMEFVKLIFICTFLALPLFAPKRITQTAVIMATMVFISMAYEGIVKWF